MAAILKGNTATLQITNVFVLKIQLIDDERLFYQFLDVADQKAFEIVEADIHHDFCEETKELEPCFYIENNPNTGRQYFLNEFIRDNYPQVTNFI